MPLVEYLLPEFILTYYQLTRVEHALEVLHLYLEEKNYDESDKPQDQLLSKGFLPESTIQDFPIRDKRVFLHIKRRRWLNIKTGKVETRDWSQVAQGTRMTTEFARSAVAGFFKSDRRSEKLTDLSPHSTNSLGRLYGVDGNRLARQYRTQLSEFAHWPQRSHAKQWLLFPQNLGTHLSIDETSLSQGELYTILTNKAAKGGKGSIVAIVAGTKAETVINVLSQLPKRQRNKVIEITLDMAGNMALIAKKCFPKAIQVTDRFHVQQLALEAVQHMRVEYRWQALEAENEDLELAKTNQLIYEPEVLSNGDTLKQLLARSRYVLYKKATDWTQSQQERASLLFDRYPDLKRAYELSQSLSYIFENTTDKLYGLGRLAKWHEKVRQAGFKAFNTVARSIQNHYETILNYFDNRSTNASAESFNAKIKAFRSQFRGVRNVEFFLYRLSQLYA